MATLFRPSRTFPLPENAEIVAKNKVPHVRILERGKPVLYPVTADQRGYVKTEAKWCADVRHADGTRRRVRFSPNKDAAAVMLADLLKKIENEKSGVHDQYADHRKRPLSELLTDYQRHQGDRGNTPKQTGQVRRRCGMVFESCGFVLLPDLDGTAEERWLSDRRSLSKEKGGLAPQTSNHCMSALKAFGNWLVKARRTAENPFRHLGRVNVEVDIRHVRRALTADEVPRLLDAARVGVSYRCTAPLGLDTKRGMESWVDG